jgi:hypothetical protein
MSGSDETMTPLQVAEWLRRIASDLRAAGDVKLVNLDEDGVSPANITLADEIWLAAFQLDPRLPSETGELLQ